MSGKTECQSSKVFDSVVVIDLGENEKFRYRVEAVAGATLSTIGGDYIYKETAERVAERMRKLEKQDGQTKAS